MDSRQIHAALSGSGGRCFLGKAAAEAPGVRLLCVGHPLEVAAFVATMATAERDHFLDGQLIEHTAILREIHWDWSKR